MEPQKVLVNLKIRRYDLGTETDPEINEKSVVFIPGTEYNCLKKQLEEICEVNTDSNKVIKLRTHDGMLVPLSFLLESQDLEKHFFIDVCNINSSHKPTASLLQDAYIDSVCQKLRNMESRIVKAELLLPQLEWRRQAHMEDTINTLSNRVSFLNRRVEELLPTEWRAEIPQTMA